VGRPRLERIDRLAAELHSGQVDQRNVPYIEHLRAVAAGVSESAKPVALLHDAMEDQGVTVELLREHDLTGDEISAIQLVTRRPDETYDLFIERIANADGRAGEFAREVKRCDLEHNLGRMTTDLERLRPKLPARYERALERLAAQPGSSSDE